MTVLRDAYTELFGSDDGREFILEYSGRFKGFNANIRMRGPVITLTASKEWRGVSSEIQKGLFQELLVRLLKKKAQTINMDLYHHFIKSLPSVVSKRMTHPVLEESFSRVNEQFFAGMMDKPNLRVGSGVNRLGTYEYAQDLVTISSILLENETLMDYVMYHELLHKKHQYNASGGRTRHHSTKFRSDERKFPNAEMLEKELGRLVMRTKRMESSKGSWLDWF